jgi:hypothetical protein
MKKRGRNLPRDDGKLIATLPAFELEASFEIVPADWAMAEELWLIEDEALPRIKYLIESARCVYESPSFAQLAGGGVLGNSERPLRSLLDALECLESRASWLNNQATSSRTREALATRRGILKEARRVWQSLYGVAKVPPSRDAVTDHPDVKRTWEGRLDRDRVLRLLGEHGLSRGRRGPPEKRTG